MTESSKTPAESNSRRRLLRIGVLALLCFFALFYDLGGPALLEPDEGRNAEVAREILRLRDWVTPHYNFIPYLDKPVFFYWLAAVGFQCFGVSEWAARLPSALAAFGCVLLVYNLARRSGDPWAGLWSSLILLTSPLFVAFSRAVIFDMTLTFFITTALWAFYRGWDAGSKSPRIFLLVMYTAMGCATLVKGPIGVMIPGAVIALHLLLSRRLSMLRRMEIPLGLALFLLVAAPWYAWAEIRNPGYLRYFLLEENFLRYLTPHFEREQPWYYYGGILAGGFFPWTALIYLPFKNLASLLKDERKLFLLLWAIVPLVVFSFSASKQPGYILPIFPPLALLTAEAFLSVLADPTAKARWPLAIPWLIFLAVFAYFTLALFMPALLPGDLQERSTEVIPLIREISGPLIPALLVVLCLGVAASLWAKTGPYYLLYCTFFSLLYFFSVGVITYVFETRSSRQIAEKALPLIRPDDRVAMFDGLSSLPFYLRVDGPIWIVSPARRLVMGSFYIAKKRPRPAAGSSDVVLGVDQFLQAWNRPGARVMVFVEEKRLARIEEQLNPTPKRLLTIDRIALTTNR
ncbi:MAG: ArnT family glycosyltransferase [Candidatus Binatia bacterium]